MIKSKKILLGTFASMAIVATPIATVVSCGKSTTADTLLVAALNKVTAKDMEANEYKKLFANTATELKELGLKDYYNDKTLELTDDASSFSKALSKTTTKEIKEALDDVQLWVTKPVPPEPTTVNVNGTSVKLDHFEKNDLTVTVKEAGKKGVASKPATKAEATKVNARLDDADDAEAMIKILEEFTTDDQNATNVVTSTVTGDKKTALTAAKTLTTTTLYNRDAVKEVVEVKTKVMVAGKEVCLDAFYPKSKINKAIIEEKGFAGKKIPGDWLDLPDKISIFPTFTLDAYKKALKEVFTNEDSKFAKEGNKKFEDADLTKIDSATTFGAAKAIAAAITVFIKKA